ncbi:radical SAM protein [bacterium]|jgi:pyruvate-formate lyase-activating enzyme|nr:radical SAM protein [bacterium]
MTTNPIRLSDYLSQTIVPVYSRCSMTCSFCPLWTPEVQGQVDQYSGQSWSESIQKGTFFRRVKQSKLFNIVGGEPALYPDLLFVLDYIKSQGGKIRLWTNGTEPVETFELILPYVDAVQLYLPSSEKEDYRLISGVDGLIQMRELIEDVFKPEGVPVELSYPVRQETIQWVPEAYDMAHELEIGLWVHYAKEARLEKESIRYLKRMRRIKNVLLTQTHQAPSHICQAVPYDYKSWAEWRMRITNNFRWIY